MVNFIGDYIMHWTAWIRGYPMLQGYIANTWSMYREGVILLVFIMGCTSFLLMAVAGWLFDAGLHEPKKGR